MIALQLLFFTLVSVTQLIRTFTEMGKLPENDVKTFSDFHRCQLVKISKHRIGDPVLAAKSGLRTGTSADKHSRKKRKRNPVDSNVKSEKTLSESENIELLLNFQCLRRPRRCCYCWPPFFSRRPPPSPPTRPRPCATPPTSPPTPETPSSSTAVFRLAGWLGAFTNHVN